MAWKWILGTGCLAVTASAAPPNIVFFLVDDMGWTDCDAYGSTYYETSNIDRLAAAGMRFTQAYAQPLCSPTRASILTGQYPSRHGVTSAGGHLPPHPPGHKFLPDNAPPNRSLRMPESKNDLDPERVTLAEALKAAGYVTGRFGKWHLGLTPPHWPDRQGFDVAFHAQPSASPPGDYFSPYGVAPPDAKPNRRTGVRFVGAITDGPSGEYITDRLTDEAIHFIEANRDRPFFLNLWHDGVHGPWGHKEAYTRAFAERRDPRCVHGNPIVASMLKSIDESLGRILERLDALGLASNTVVFFFSDNGGNVHSNTPEDGHRKRRGPDDPQLKDWLRWAGDLPPTSNHPLRSGKGRLYEGGVRVPLIVRWLGRVRAGAVSDAVVGCIDFFRRFSNWSASLRRRASRWKASPSFRPCARPVRSEGRPTSSGFPIWSPGWRCGRVAGSSSGGSSQTPGSTKGCTSCSASATTSASPSTSPAVIRTRCGNWMR